MEINHALWRLRQARLPQDRTMTSSLLALDLGNQSFTRHRIKRGGKPGTHAAIAREDVA
jgi:hypothetical protein